MKKLFSIFFSQQKRLLSLDVIRGIAVMMVVLSHNPVFPESRWPIYKVFTFINKIGWAGVDLFFVLSGFLVGGLLIVQFKKESHIDTKRFIIRRLFKVWPVYYIFLSVYLFVQTVLLKNSFLSLLNDHWPNFLHIQNYFASTASLGWLWSLGVEEHFYLLLPFLMSLWLPRYYSSNKNRSLKPLIVGFGFIALFSISLRFFTLLLSEGKDPFTFVFPSHLRFDSLFSGVFLGFLVHFHEDVINKIKPYSWLLLLVGLSLVFIPSFYPDKHQRFLYPWGMSFLYIAFCCLVLFTYLCSQKTWPKKVEMALKPFLKIFAFIGLRSYSIYVWHGFFAKPIAHRLVQVLSIDPHGSWGFFYELIYWSVPIFIGTMSFHLIEEPFLKLRNALFPSRGKVGAQLSK